MDRGRVQKVIQGLYKGVQVGDREEGRNGNAMERGRITGKGTIVLSKLT